MAHLVSKPAQSTPLNSKSLHHCALSPVTLLAVVDHQHTTSFVVSRCESVCESLSLGGFPVRASVVYIRLKFGRHRELASFYHR